MSILVPELRLLFHEEQAQTRAIPEERANAKEELSKPRPGGTARMAVVLVTLLLALIGASGASAQPADRVEERKFYALLALAQQAASADGTPAGADIFAAQAECRTAYELEQLRRAAPPDYIVADDGSGPRSTITPPPHSPGFGMVRRFGLGPQRHREPIERIARCLRALSWDLRAQQLRSEVQFQEIKAQLQELKKELAKGGSQ